MDERTPLSLALKTITTHVFTLGSYTHLTKTLRRPIPNKILALRLLFFFFVPTLPLVELILTVGHSLLTFLRNFEDDDAIHIRYYVSSAIGLHAEIEDEDSPSTTSNSPTNPETGTGNTRDAGKGKEEKRKNTVPLLRIGTHAAEKRLRPISWSWTGQLLVALFSLMQAVGTIVLWARRIDFDWPLNFDHRIGAMGIASTICSTMLVILLLLRLDWKVSKAFVDPSKSKGSQTDTGPLWKQFAIEAVLSIYLHGLICFLVNNETLWYHISFGIFFFWSKHADANDILLKAAFLLFLFLFRNDILRRLGLEEGWFMKWWGARRAKRAKSLLMLTLIVFFVTDIVLLFAWDIKEVVNEWKRQDYDRRPYWWQDPFSDSIIVI